MLVSPCSRPGVVSLTSLHQLARHISASPALAIALHPSVLAILNAKLPVVASALQPLLLIAALLAVPCMLFPKPYVLRKRHMERHQHDVSLPCLPYPCHCDRLPCAFSVARA